METGWTVLRSVPWADRAQVGTMGEVDTRGGLEQGAGWSRGQVGIGLVLGAGCYRGQLMMQEACW